jgi:basic amino acid/polyamine antiporter, APA family
MATLTSSSDSGTPTLRRALGRWDLTAFGINIVIGAAIFLTPSLVSAQLGSWSPIAVVLAGVVVLSIGLCYAEVGSRFDGTGGPYLYTREAFGDFVGFEVGWMTWFTRVSSLGAVVNGIALSVGFFWPAAVGGSARAALIGAVVVALTMINVRGIRHSALLVNSLTIAKLVPLLAFVAIGMFFVDWSRFADLPRLSATQMGAGALLLIYAYGGFEVIGVPAGESQQPRKHLPFALVMTITGAGLIMTLVQVVAMGTLPQIATSTTPLADAALHFMGAAGALMIGIGSIFSMTGNSAGSMLGASRVLFALGENSTVPQFFARVHPAFRTPANAIWFSAAVALALALTGSFAVLLITSTIARLLTYAAVAAATLTLRLRRFEGRVPAATFRLPFGAAIPMLALVISAALLAGATFRQLAAGALALAAGAALYGLTALARRERRISRS